jgi:hypothetical protein
MDFDVQDPTQRGPLFSHLSAFIAAERAYIAQRGNLFDAIGFTFPSVIGNVVGDPAPEPIAHITDVIPETITNAIPASVTTAVPLWWQRIRGQHGG